MPQYAPYGNAIYGITAYGSPPAVSIQTTMSVSPIPTSGSPSIGLYDTLQVNWVLPGGNWNQMVLVRSSFAVPASPFTNDGVQLLNQTSQFNTSFTDTGLQTGRFYYYALYVFDTDVSEWLMAASAQGLCLTDYGFQNLFVSWTPDWYMEQDQLLVPPDPLRRFLNLLGFEMNWVRSEVETLFTLNSPEYISGAMLPYLGGNVGIDYEPALGMGLSRNLVSQAVQLYKTKGTFQGVQAAAAAYSGYGCTLTLAPNLEIQLDDATADRSVGHWVPQNSSTTLSSISSLSAVAVPQHANYLPIQGNTGISTGLLTTNNVEGYMPSNNENMLLLSANSAFTWNQQSQNTALPPALYGAAAVFDANNGTTVMFGGATSPGSLTGTAQTWIFNGTYWTQAFPATSPPSRVNHAMAYDAASGTVIMFGGQNGGASYLHDTWSWNGTTWTQLVVSAPTARIGHTMAQWTSTGVVLFGGFDPNVGYKNDTWLWNGTSWTLQTPVHSPGVRANHAMAYDSFEQATPNLGNGVVVLFGGYNGTSTPLSDTWIWNGTDWTSPSPAHVPGSRYLHAMAYNIATDRVEMFGGFNNFSTTYGDTWQWGGTDWQNITNSVSNPPARQGHVMAYDVLGTVVLFGGYLPGTGMLQDTWLWNGATSQWTQREGTQTPLPREDAAICYDTATSAILMFGGVSATGTYLSSTWSWTNAGGWTQLPTSVSPSGRAGAQMVYTTAGNVILFGGINNSGTSLNDTWVWNGTVWAQQSPVGGVQPLARNSHSMVYDTNASKVILFGGWSHSSKFNDTWYYASNTWTQQAPSTSPSARKSSQFVYTTGGLSLLFSGNVDPFGGSTPDPADTWQWNSSTNQWAQLAPATSPPGRDNALMVYNTATSAVFLFAGINFNTGVSYSDSWEYASSTWTQVNFSPNPYPRYAMAGAYYPPTQQVLFFGGYSGSFFGDTWLSSIVGGSIYVSECNSTNALTLGIPVVPSNSYMLSTVGPVGWWRLNETFAGPVYDSGAIGSSGGNGGLYGTGTLIGQPNGAVPIDSCYTFNGNGYVSIPNNENYQFGSSVPFAYGGFFKTTSSATMIAMTTQLNPGSNASAGYTISYSGGFISALVTDGTHHPTATTGTAQWADGNWHFVVAVVDRVSNKLFLYIDSRLQASTPLASLGSSANTVRLGIGGGGSGAVGTGRFAGSAQEVFVESSAMSQTQVSALYTSLLGQTSPVTQSQYVLSGYFQPLPSAVTLESFTAQLDWYSSNGSLISSSVGSPVAEIAGQWTRPYAVATPPAGAVYIGRTFKSVNQNMTGDQHLFDAVQLEVNTQATPGPTGWTPPRDLWLNLFPYARNLVINGQGTLGATGFTSNPQWGNTITAVTTGPVPTSGPTWPANVTGGFSVPTLLTGTLWSLEFETAFGGSSIMPVNQGQAYSASIWVLYPASVGYNLSNQLNLNISWYSTTSSSSYISTTTNNGVAGIPIGQANGNWIQVVNLDAVAPAGAKYAQIQLIGNTSSGGSITVYVAAPYMGPGLNTTYFDGLFSPSPDYSYEGTPVLSPTSWYPNVLTRLDRLIEVMPQYTPIGSTFSIYTHANAWANVGLH